MGIVNFFKNAFSDMKKSARAQHEVDKANFAAAKAESRANFEEARAMSKKDSREKMMQNKRNEVILDASKRKADAEERIDKTRNK